MRPVNTRQDYDHAHRTWWPRGARAGAVAICLGIAVLDAEAQHGLKTTLGPPSAELTEPFGRVVNVRELADGRVLVSDGPEKRVVVADFRTQTVRQIGRNGSGPGEYVNAGVLHALRADTTLMTDAQSRRWLLLAGDRIVATVPADHPAMLATRGSAVGTDRYGRVLAWSAAPPPVGVSSITTDDSLPMTRVEWTTARSDTVALIRRPSQTYTGWTDPDGRPYYAISRPAFTVGEVAGIAADSWVAIVRLDPYRVDWRAPDGPTMRGAPIPYAPVKVTAREKEFYLQVNARSMNTQPALPPWMTPEQRAASVAARNRQWTDFPAFIPPVQPPVITAMTDNAVVIRRQATADFPDPIFDVVNRSGRLVARLQLKAGERLLGSGQGCVYVAAEDADGLDHLRRYSWP